VPEIRTHGTVLPMNQSKPSGPASGPRTSTPAKAVAPAGSTGIPAAPRPTGAPSRPAAGTPKPRADLRGSPPERIRPDPPQPPAQTGKVVHDERGNAVWDWLKQTGRNAIESTTRMLRRLETPELEVEQPHEEELRIQPDSGILVSRRFR
jgi:hypothetical protein